MVRNNPVPDGVDLGTIESSLRGHPTVIAGIGLENAIRNRGCGRPVRATLNLGLVLLDDHQAHGAWHDSGIWWVEGCAGRPGSVSSGRNEPHIFCVRHGYAVSGN